MPMMSVAPMAVMHEDVHERACQQKQKWQRTDDVRQVLCQQKYAATPPITIHPMA
jgi:hypothetical protein